MWLFKDLHIVGWPLLAAAILQASGAAGWPPPGWRESAWVARLCVVRRVCLAVLHACVAAILIYVVFALARPAFTEWVESGVAAIARDWVGGGNVYPDASALRIYGVFPYGPLLFQVVGWLLAVSGGSRPAVKAAYVVWALLTYGLMFCVLRRRGAGRRDAALAVEFLAVVVGIMGFMVKADIMLISCSVAACGVMSLRGRPALVTVLIGGLAGLAAAVKIHGVFYILPAAVECLLAGPHRRWGRFVAAGVIAALVTAAPFLVPRTSVADYVIILRIASNDGLLPGIFVSNLSFIGLFVLCVHLVYDGKERDAAYKRLMGSVLASGFLVSIFAAKVEAGPHHLIPLLPYLCLPFSQGLRSAFDARRAVLLVLFVVSFQPITSVARDILQMLAHWYTPLALI